MHGCMAYACVCGGIFCNICSRYCGRCGRDSAAAFPAFNEKELARLNEENSRLRQTVGELSERIIALEQTIEDLFSDRYDSSNREDYGRYSGPE